jgi:DNA-binding GntR family transcriptional regulator
MAPTVLGTRTVAQTVTDRLRDAILSGEIPAGTRLRHVDMTRRFGVSTTPVREAFVALQAEGLLLGDPYRGVVVFRPSHADLRENYEIRIALESLAAARAAERATPADVAALRELLDAMRALVDGGAFDGPAYSDLDRRFHERIAQLAGRPRLLALITTLRASARAYMHVLARTDANVHHSVRGHEEMLRAIAAGDGPAAAAALRAHLESNLEFIATLIPPDGAA